jgi:hypothetical protein
MKKLLFTIAFLFSIAYAQNISISKLDIDRIFSYSVGTKLFDNSVFSISDTLLSKPTNAVYSRLSKFQGANLSITLVNGTYKGRILKSGSVYYELAYTNSTTYTFVKKDAKDIQSELSYKTFPEAENLPVSTDMISLEDMKRSRELSAFLPQDNEMELAESGWACIWFDIDGTTVNSPMWNYGQPLVCAPSPWRNSADSTAYFLRRIKDFMYPFRIVVTYDSLVYAAAPVSQRIRCIVTPTGAWYSPGTLGVAYVTSFSWGDDTPFFVFQQSLNATNFLNLIETAKHEIGHPLGLYHQSKYDSTTCGLQQSLSQGYGTGELSWAPVMGWPLVRNANTWSSGPTPNGCTFLQDNLNIIISTNGFGYRSNTPSTYISSFAEARGVGSGERSIRFANFMPVSSDSASFKIVISKLGVTTIKASPSADGGATTTRALMTMKIRLYDIRGNFVAESDDNINSISGVIQQAIAPGTYYLRVYKRDLPQSICPAFFNPRGYGQYGWFFVTMD